MWWSFGCLTFMFLLAVARAQVPCSMNSTITVTLDEGNVSASQSLDSNSPYQASLPVLGSLLNDTNGIALTMISDNPLAPNPNNTFRIEDVGTGTRIRLITSVDRDGPDFTTLDDTEIISFRLKCTLKADSSTTAYATVIVNINDINDNTPEFINMPYSVSVEELTRVGTTIYRQITALDKDSGLRATINYAILAGDGSVTDGSKIFNLTSDRFPYLVINESLDFESMYTLGQTSLVVNVVAKDLGTPPRSAVAQVNVTVTDIDDMAPAFVYADCLLSGIYCVNPRYSTSVVSGLVTNPLTIYPLVGFTRQNASTIRAVDRDTLRSPLTFRIAGTSPAGYEIYFSVAGSGPVSSRDKDIYTANLTQLRAITRNSTLTRVEVYILAIQANKRYEERATVTVEIDVPNSSPPTVTTATGFTTGYIYENSRPGQNVLDGTTSLSKPLQLIVTDPDDSISGQKTAFSFFVTGNGLFNVDYNGYIYLANGSLDYETTKYATFFVRVTETNTVESRFTDVTVTILVLDLNDNDPVFTSTGAVHVTVREGDYTLSSRLLAQVNATDADSGANGLLTYSIMSLEPAVPSVFFTINANTGYVSLSGRVTYPSDYVVVVKASDSAVSPDAIRSATKNLYVNVTSAGNNAPQIPSTMYTITISEGTVPGTSVFTVPATDPDGQVLSFNITAGNAAGKFSIDSSGQLETVGFLDRDKEDTRTYNLTVTVRDTTTPLPLSATTTVSVILTDVNDNNPIFPSQYLFTVTENQPVGTSVGTVTATDADQPNTVNSELTYRLNMANNYFTINLTTGQITTLQPLDYESQSQHIFEVLAVDHASDSRTGTVSVTVLVTDVQDSVPLFTQQIFNANVAEGSANAFVVTVSAVDADVVDNIQYRFLSPATASTFTINSVLGQITTAVALDYETQRYYEFFVTTADGQGSTNPSSTATVRVTVLDQNDNIPVLSLSAPSVQVFEDVEVNHVLVLALATDADAANTSNSEIRFSIVSVTPSSGSSFFSIDRDNGQLVIAKSLTNDPGVNQYQIIIRASDRGIPVQISQAMFTVTALRNTAPLLVSNSILVNISHTIAPTTFVTIIQAVDHDPGDYGRLNYQLVGDSIASRYFQLLPTENGVNITTIDQLTKDTARTYYLTITARDNAGIVSKTATATVTVNVNRNLQDPRWLNLPANLQTTISITENDPLGQVYALSAEDLDILPPDNEVAYHLTGNDPAMNYFKIDSSSGVISLIKLPVQNRTISQFTVTVSLTDKGVPPRTTGTATLFVNVLRNEQPPVYINTSYYVQLREGVPLGTSVVQVSATDNDTNINFNQITYRIIGDDTAPNFFAIASSGSMAGRIITSGNLSTVSTDIFRIQIEAVDNGAFQRNATAIVYVKVLRNLNRPQWRFNYSAVVLIPETQNVDSVIYTLPLVTDSDSTSPDNITNYSLTGSTPIQGQNYYQVNATTGDVVIKQDLTRDHNITLYKLTFQAYDLGTPSLTATQTFTLTVNVYRNTRPLFNPSIYRVSVDETRNVNTSILLLFANDIDTMNYPGGLFGQLSYSIASPASAKPYFMVVVDNGQVVLRVASSLVNAPLDQYLLLVQVSDGGGLSDYAEITIDISRNLYAPQFTQTSYVVNITEDISVGSDINITVLARDADLKDVVTYQLIKDNRGGASLNFFYIERNTGNIFLRGPLTGVNTTEFEFTVRAIDSGRPPKEADVNVTIKVIHLPVPVFVQPFNTTISEDVATSTSVMTVNAAIQRTTSSGQIVYEAIGQLPAIYYFSIDRFTGVVIVQRDLRRDRSPSYTLTVKAYDTSAPTKFSTQDISIMVRRNVNSPRFDSDSYFISVNDNDPMGRLVASLNATDKDPDVLVYNLTGDQRCQQVFYLTSSTSGVGNLYLGTNLLSTNDTSFNCTVTVTDNGYPISNSGSAQVLITVARRQPPAFVLATYSVETNETVSVNTTVVRVQASSVPIVERIAYRTEGIYPADTFFLVDNFTGYIQIRQDLRADSLRLTIYTLRVVAYDTARPLLTGTALVNITVRRNLNSPVIGPPSVTLTVREDTDITFWGYRVNVTDPDSRNLTCSITGNAKAQEFFRIEPDSCLIKMKNSLLADPDKTKEYRIQVLVSDDGMPPNSVTGEIIINVQRDRFNPVFTNLPDTKTTEETASIGSEVYNIDASDEDRIGNLIYQLDDYLPAETFFAINSTTGVITVRNSPNSDVLERGSYTLHVCVYDDAWPSNRVCSNLTVVVNRNPNGPHFLQKSYNRTIRANFPPGDIVIQMTAQDVDGDKAKFTSEASTSIQNIFYVNPDSGSVMLIESLINITTIQVYQFNVSVTDGRRTNPKTDRVTVTISITPLQGPPVFSNSSVEITIPLTQSNGSIVYTLFARDPDQQGFIQYRLIGFPLGQEYFAVNPNTGAVTLRKPLTLNPDKFPIYVLFIEAYDSVEPEDKNYMTLIIHVNRNLYAPEFIAASSNTASVNDYDPVGTSVLKVSAQDKDITEPENNIIYRIDVGRAGGTEYFRIDSNTGLITIINPLYNDTARSTQYTLYVLATDPSYNPKTATATVFVTVERNVPPTFNPNAYSMSVSEAAPLFNPIITVFATDVNPKNSLNGQLVFSIVDTAARNVWQIDEQNGTLYPRVGLRNIDQEIWNFTIQVNDKGIPSLFDRASVRLTIIRSGKPTFLNTEYFINNKDENTPVNTTLIQVQANDPQSSSTLVYEIRGDGLAQIFFEINNATGDIRTSKLFTDDDNKTPSYTVRVFAYRQSNPLDYAEALVHITVIRNPSAPSFLHGDLTFRIPESQPLSVGFGKVNATDPDVGTNGQVTYSISEIMPSYASSYFFVNPNTGTLSVIGNLMEDPTTPQYVLTVVAKDNGAPNRKQAQVKVTVTVSRNPNPPIFTNFVYTVSINENVPAGSDVVQVIATDKDNDKVFYKMEYNPPITEYFRLNNNTGSITTATELWRDRTQSYTLKITASDNAAASKTSTATVSIIVARNPNPPVFLSNQYEKRISEYTEVRASIIRVVATDGDNPNSDSGRLRYSINATVPSIAANYFTISPTYGEINLARTLTTDEIQDLSVQLSAVAQDISESPKFAQAQIRIFIIRNQFAPKFIGGNTYTVNASDALPVGYTLLTVTATDNDTNVPESSSTSNAEVEYQIIGDTNSFARYFHVRQNGEVYVAQSLTISDKRDSVSVTIRATDKSWKPKYTDATLTVRLNYTSNQVGHLGFTQPEWIIDVFENQAPGDLKILDVENQDTSRISCSIILDNIQGSAGPVFSIRRDVLSKNCILTLMTSLDFETRQRYDLVVKVTSSITKRQAFIYNTWSEAKITVMVLDVNDNRPTFVFPLYPPFSGLQKKYISAVSLSARAGQSVLSITATDADSGNNGNVTYSEGDTNKRVPKDIKTPFSINPVDGVIVPSGEFDKADNSPRTFRFEVLAQDNPKNVYKQETDNAEVVINLIEDKHRFILVLKDSTPDQVLADKEMIRRAIQSETGLIAIIEIIERRRILQDNKQIIAMPKDTDIVFVLSQLEPPNFPLIENSDPKITAFLANNRVSALAPEKYKVDEIRTPYAEGSELQFRITKSYVWWLDDPWAALIAITAISVLLCLVGLVFIIFTHARYEKYINQYRVMHVGYEQPEFVEPPSFLREYETQSLQMYVPPDEAIQGTDTVALNFEADEDTIEDTEEIGAVTSAINPVFHDDEPNQFHRQRSEFPEGTTML